MKKFSHYEIIRRLGKGAMGRVYLAYDTKLDRKVALKFPDFRDLTARERDYLIARFDREAQSAAQLKSPHICAIHAFGQAEGRHYIEMEFVDGVSLAEEIAASEPPRLGQVAREFSTLARALAHAHSQGVVHRDLKPSNVMINRRREPVVLDFGLARRIDGEGLTKQTILTEPGMILGSTHYTSPEQIQALSTRNEPATDIYSLGVMLFERATGTRPFVGSSIKVLRSILRDDPPAPTAARPDLPKAFDSLCLRMLAREPTRRYGSMGEVADALTPFIDPRRAAEQVTVAGSHASLGDAELISEIQVLLERGRTLRDSLDRELAAAFEATQHGDRQKMVEHLERLARINGWTKFPPQSS